jgi:hypothetical protein
MAADAAAAACGHGNRVRERVCHGQRRRRLDDGVIAESSSRRDVRLNRRDSRSRQHATRTRNDHVDLVIDSRVRDDGALRNL